MTQESLKNLTLNFLTLNISGQFKIINSVKSVKTALSKAKLLKAGKTSM